MIETIYMWMIKPAKRWQFWLPQSGVFGGIIFGTVISAIFLTAFLLGQNQ